MTNALDQTWHKDHFVCTECKEPFPDLGFFEKDKKPYCENDYRRLFCEK